MGNMYRPVFTDCTSLQTLNIGDNVTNIPDYAFYNCRGLTGVLAIPNSVTSIGDFAFAGCSRLTEVTIGNSVTSIGSGAFKECSGLTSVTIPNSITAIGDDVDMVYNEGAFYDCHNLISVYYTGDIAKWIEILFGGEKSNPLHYAHNLYINDSLVTELVIPDTVTEIKQYAFCGGSCLHSLTIPRSVTDIGIGAFSGCREIQMITVDNDNVVYDSRDNCNAIIETNTNKLIIASNNTIIPNSVKTIAELAFCGLGIDSITIPNSIDSIGKAAFSDCTNLTTVNFDATNCVYMGKDYSNLDTNSLFQFCDNFSTLNIGDNVTNIPDYAFYECNRIKSIRIGSSVENIGIEAFGNCDSIIEIHIYANIPPVLDDYAFSVVDNNNSIEYNTAPTIWIPCKTEDSYRNDNEWGRFSDIRSNTPTHSIDTIVNNFVTIGDHTFYSSGNYTFSMPSEIGCDTIYNIQLHVLAEPVYDIGPNPTSKMLNINSDGFISAVEFYTTTGQLVMRKEVNSYEANFDMEGLVDGVYILRIYGEESGLPSVSKIVKE